ncbi:carbohydrate sulfotransferase 14-like [Styela clava]
MKRFFTWKCLLFGLLVVHVAFFLKMKHYLHRKSEHKQALSEVELRQNYRKSNLHNGCLRLGLHKPMVTQSDDIRQMLQQVKLLYSDKYKFLVCEIPKCGCSSIKKLLLITEGIVNETNPQAVKSWLAHELGDKHLDLKNIKNVTEIQKRLDTYQKLIIVRDPLYRLLSAYINKLEHEYPWNRGFAKISKNIHQQFVKNETGKLASFGEFFSYLTEENKYDRHWELYHKLCLPCSISYDYIAHIETIDDDMVDFMDKLAITNITFPRNYEKSKQTNTDTFERYIGEVPENLVKGIRKKYKTDFDLFGFK